MQVDRCLVALLLSSMTLLPALGGGEEPEVSHATVPLTEILRLHREVDEGRRKPDVEPPPVSATVQGLELEGRVLDDGADFTVGFRIVVLENEAWSRVPLLRQDEATHISHLPAVKNAVFVVEDDYLTFLTQRSGSYEFQISFLRHAERDGRKRMLRVEYVQATLAVCRLAIDESLFRVTTTGANRTSDGVILYPRDHAFTFGWERRTDVAEKRQSAPRPAVESLVTIAGASLVSTLEGQRITRIRYDLQLAGRRQLEIEIPTGQVVERAYLNGVSVPAGSADEKLSLEVTPTREGDESGTLELVLSETGRRYFLSGTLDVELPRVSWPINEIYLELHLPEVFNYTWSGGSLAPVESSPSVSYAYNLPQPGKRLSFHQHLISASSADVRLEYAVDLAGHYFTP